MSISRCTTRGKNAAKQMRYYCAERKEAIQFLFGRLSRQYEETPKPLENGGKRLIQKDDMVKWRQQACLGIRTCRSHERESLSSWEGAHDDESSSE
jgi:hypothetical protein